MPLSVSPDAAGCRNFIFSIAPGVCTEAVGYDAWLKENAGQTPSAGESRQGQERAPAGARAHAAGKLERDLEAADFFQEQAREFQSLTELEEAMTAYEDQMDQNMADAADTAAHTAAAFKTLPIAELVTMHGSKGLEYDAVFLPCCMEGVVPHKKSKDQAALEEGNAGVCVPVSC